ncbi:uncharacterized protein LOC127738283 [Mytilus californianus]|uniref:uncharacterized protein LOC127738283 n=1 Tax=Mytilus californianus TaxID=6549 RepID=UPI0022483507|nr:uncharacterized protein LOC127738283 [Mytilus californianus]XP_052105430.1 uncharacterized protein LOC127738283 [Mytilus californianus]XP_052105431.1 uncharacterized protein LOC127738283 [Mytilus californianus]
MSNETTTDTSTAPRKEESGKSTNENLAELLSDISAEREESVFSLKRLLDVGNNKNVLRQNYVDETVLKFTMRRIEGDKDMVAADLCREQNVFKKKLKVYRDKQRKLTAKRLANERKIYDTKHNNVNESTDSLEDLLRKQLTVRRPVIKKQRPATCIPTMLQLKTKTDHLKGTESVEFDKKFFINRKRYRVDLRPKISHTYREKPEMLEKVVNGNRGYLTDPKEAVRYFEDDEIDERKGIYALLTEIRKKVEQRKLKNGQQKMNLYLDKYFPRKIKSVILSDGQETDLEKIQDQAQNITVTRRSQTTLS